MKGDVFEPDALVFAKIRGYPAWPAKITAALDDGKKPKKYSVFFFGTYEVATVKVEDLFRYNAQSKEKYGSANLKRKGFADAMREIEESPDMEARPYPPPAPTTPRTVSAGAAPGSTPKQRGRGRKRKEDASTPLEPGGKRRRLDSGEAPVAAAAAAEPQLSRSGRKIKPKRFADDEGRKKSSPAAGRRQTPAAQPAGGEPDEDELAPAVKTEEDDEDEEAEQPLPMDTAEEEEGGAGDGLAEDPLADPAGQPMDGQGDDQPPEPERRDVRYKPYPCHETEDIIRVVDSATVEKQDDGRKVMYVKAKCGEMLEIDISDRERPKEFKSEKARIMWDTATAINLARLRHQLERGECVPERLREKLLARGDVAAEVKEKLKNEKRQEMRKSKLWWLRDEARLIELDYHIKLNLIIDEQNHEKCIKVFEELSQMNMAPLMLKKNPEIVETVRKCRKYTGSSEIRELADKCYQKFKKMFVVPPGKMFREYFDEQLAQFRKITADMPEEKVIRMVRDPLFQRPGEASSESEDEVWPPAPPHTNGNGAAGPPAAADAAAEPEADAATDQAAEPAGGDASVPADAGERTEPSAEKAASAAAEPEPAAAAEPESKPEPKSEPEVDQEQEQEPKQEKEPEPADDDEEDKADAEAAQEPAEPADRDLASDAAGETLDETEGTATEGTATEGSQGTAEELAASSEDEPTRPADDASTNDEAADASSESRPDAGESTAEESESTSTQ